MRESVFYFLIAMGVALALQLIITTRLRKAVHHREGDPSQGDFKPK